MIQERLVLIALVFVGATSAQAADTLVHGASGYRCDAAGLQRFDGLRFDERGRVVGTGAAIASPDAELRRVDADGSTLLPGLIDAHGHVVAFGRARAAVDLIGTRSAAEAVARVVSFARANPDKRWIVGRGWNQEMWAERRFPTAAMLDEAVGDRPVWLKRVDGHAAWASSRAMAAAGIAVGAESPPGGRIITAPDGRPSGIFVDAAMSLVEAHVPAPTLAEDRAATELAMSELVSLGLTGVHDAGVDAQQLAVYRELAADDALLLRIYGMLSETARDALSEPLVGLARDRLTVRSVKLYADGALGSRGAALLAPYADEPGNLGLAFKDHDSLYELVSGVAGKGFQVNVHAIGDAANRLVLDVFDDVQDGTPSPLRHRVEHAQVISEPDLKRFSELGVIASMQPTHATSDAFMAEERLGEARLGGAYAWRSLMEAGALISAGSDFPVEPANPFFGLHAAVTRTNREGQPEGGWRIEEAMTLEEALCAFTRDAAYAGHMEERVGSLSPGQWADFILVDRDIFDMPPAELWNVRVLETWVGGERVYRAAADEG